MKSGFLSPIRYAVSYGRGGTPMAGFLDEAGGPMTEEEIFQLSLWLQEQGGYEEIELSRDPVSGDIGLGEKIYAAELHVCIDTLPDKPGGVKRGSTPEGYRINKCFDRD